MNVKKGVSIMNVNFLLCKSNYIEPYVVLRKSNSFISELQQSNLNYLESVNKSSDVIEINNSDTMFNFADKDTGKDFKPLDLVNEVEKELGLDKSRSTIESNIFEQIFKDKGKGSYAQAKCKEFGRDFKTSNREEKLLNYKLIKALFLNKYRDFTDEEIEEIPNLNYGKNKNHLKELFLIHKKLANAISPELMKYEAFIRGLMNNQIKMVFELFEITQFYLKNDNIGMIDKDIAVDIHRLSHDIVPSLKNIFDISDLVKENLEIAKGEKYAIKYSPVEALYIDISRQIQIVYLNGLKEAYSMIRTFVDKIKNINDQILEKENPKEISANFKLYDYALKTYCTEAGQFSEESIKQIADFIGQRSLKRIKEKIDNNSEYFTYLFGTASVLDIAYYEKLTKIKPQNTSMTRLENHVLNFLKDNFNFIDDKRRLLTLAEYYFLDMLPLLVQESMNLGYVYITDMRMASLDIILNYHEAMLKKENYMQHHVYTYQKPIELLGLFDKRLENRINSMIK